MEKETFEKGLLETFSIISLSDIPFKTNGTVQSNTFFY